MARLIIKALKDKSNYKNLATMSVRQMHYVRRKKLYKRLFFALLSIDLLFITYILLEIR